MAAQVNLDDKPRWSRYMIPVAQQSGPKTAATKAVQGQNPGSEFVDVVVDRRDASGRVYANDVQGYVLLRSGWRDAVTGGGTGSGARSGGAGGQALAAVQANLPQYTGGGQGFQIGAQSTSVLVPPRQDDWKGLDSYNPDNKITGDYSPRSINFDGFARIGSRCVRRGVAKCTDDLRTVRTGGGAVLNSDYRGLSLVPVHASRGDVGDQIILCYHDKDVEIGSAPGANVATSYHLCTIGPHWGKTRNMSGMPGPSFALSDQTGGVMRVTVDYVGFSSAIAGLKKQSITAISIRYNGPYSGATPRFPQDIDGNDGTGSVSFKDRFAWIGTNTSYDTSALTLGKYWVTCWAIGIEGISEPTFASLTLA
jgi:hypothetical protein